MCANKAVVCDVISLLALTMHTFVLCCIQPAISLLAEKCLKNFIHVFAELDLGKELGESPHTGRPLERELGD